MKKIMFLLVSIMALASCASYPVAQQSGKDDVGYLLFVSQGKYSRKYVDVQLDGTEFKAQPVKTKKSNLKGKTYSVAPGTRKIVVKDAVGNTLYNKTLFISAQETKKIQLP